MEKRKSFDVPKRLIWDAFQSVKANKGSAGTDGLSIEDFERNLKRNLYKIWNRMSSGSYFPPPVLAVSIPKKSGGQRVLGIPTVGDRVAQTAVKTLLEPVLEPIFHEDSYGYRPRKSAHQALEVVRKRCWENNWVIEFDIKGLFDNIDHGLLMKALRFHTCNPWILLYVKRWLTVSIQNADGNARKRDRGTPQGGVISPLLANLFMHYAFDRWMTDRYPNLSFCRYADDGVIHCRNRHQAQDLLVELNKRLRECSIELQSEKTRIVYCKDQNRTYRYAVVSFDFLGYNFRSRRSKDRYGRIWWNFSPAMSRSAGKYIRQTVRSWRIQLKSDKSIYDLSRMFRPYIRGWANYYCAFYKTEFSSVGEHLNAALLRWSMRKYKRLRGHPRRARLWIAGIIKQNPDLFPHWKLGFVR